MFHIAWGGDYSTSATWLVPKGHCGPFKVAEIKCGEILYGNVECMLMKPEYVLGFSPVLRGYRAVENYIKEGNRYLILVQWVFVRDTFLWEAK